MSEHYSTSDQAISVMGPHQAALTRAQEELGMLAHDVDRLFGHAEPHLRPAVEVEGIKSEGFPPRDLTEHRPTSSATSSINNLADDIAKVRNRIQHLIAHIEV